MSLQAGASKGVFFFFTQEQEDPDAGARTSNVFFTGEKNKGNLKDYNSGIHIFLPVCRSVGNGYSAMIRHAEASSCAKT